MAFAEKQKKRAQRVKTKARQNRMGKPKAQANVVHPILGAASSTMKAKTPRSPGSAATSSRAPITKRL
ncbi:hypothetical protein ACRS3X_18385 [Ectopseudomonas hydrolytica]|uniref:hypothetical protein n=1 Tax=Ectopseudomonas hydrolytica TaxID=2493633 RepID=UPI003EE0BE54